MSSDKTSPTACPICSGLADQEYASQKYGWPENDTQLPVAVGQLERIRDLRPEGSRRLEVLRCPACGTCYLYRTDYEYLVNGSEDEQFLTRLTEEQAKEYDDVRQVSPGATSTRNP